MIKEFQGEYRWLSNFAPCKIVLEGVEYASIEHAYVSAKSDDKEWKEFCANPENTAGHLKRAGRDLELKPDWDEKRFGIMRECIEQKYAQEPYRTKLEETGFQHIQEGNKWNDKFWGVCLKTNEGENNLGKMIMEVRYGLVGPMVDPKTGQINIKYIDNTTDEDWGM